MNVHKISAILTVLVGFAVAACGGDNPPDQPEQLTVPTSPAEPARVTIAITVETDSGLIGLNHDDEACVFVEPEYELRDAAGTLIDVGRWEDEGTRAGESRWAAAGEIESLDPFRCVLHETLSAEPADIYTLTVTTQQTSLAEDEVPVTGEASFIRDEAGSVVVEITRRR